LEFSSVVGKEAERFVLRQSSCFKYEIARDSEGWTGEEKETQKSPTVFVTNIIDKPKHLKFGA
jgi:hypothetical protein